MGDQSSWGMGKRSGSFSLTDNRCLTFFDLRGTVYGNDIVHPLFLLVQLQRIFSCGPLECGAWKDNGRGEEINIIFLQPGSSINLLATLGSLATCNPADAAMVAKAKKIRTELRHQNPKGQKSRPPRTTIKGPGSRG